MNQLMLCLCFALSSGPGRAPDRFFAEDKVKHFAASFFFTSVAASGARAAGLERTPALVTGASVGLGLGLAKEFRDRRSPETSTASALDLAWDALGVGAATVLVAQAR
jgi:uncharacterized protein YfiM (DUF2279 family)